MECCGDSLWRKRAGDTSARFRLARRHSPSPSSAFFHEQLLEAMARVVAALVAVWGATAADIGKHHHPIKCDVAVVGGGPGGSYLSARLALDSPSQPHVCLFERGTRVGGRVHSLRGEGPKGDLVVEAGAYRFVLNKTCAHIEGWAWCLSTPLTRGIVEDFLGLHWTRYNPDPAGWDHELAKITDADGDDLGFLTFVEALVAKAKATGRFALYFEHELSKIAVADGGYDLAFADGSAATAAKVALNLPQVPLLRVLAKSEGFASAAEDVPDVLHAMTSFPMIKLYVHYADAWWRNDLGLVSGPYNNSDAWHWDDDPSPMAKDDCLASRQTPLMLQGSYHDGDVRCDANGKNCRGFIQASYMGDVQTVRLLQQFHFPDGGDAVAHLSAADPHDNKLLLRVHEALLNFHEDALKAAGAYDRVKALAPDVGVLSIWDQKAAGFEAACHMPKALGLDGNGIPPEKIPQTALQPFPKTAPGVFLANEAYGTVECFAEGSLVMAENIAAHLGVPPPAWIDPAIYNRDVLFNATAPEPHASGRAKGASHPHGDLAFIRALAQ